MFPLFGSKSTNANTESNLRELDPIVGELKDEREALREEISQLKNDLSELRGDYREAYNDHKENMQRIRDEFVATEDELRKKIHKLGVRCAAETAEYEHEYHYNREQKGAELARIETRIEMLTKQEAEWQKIANLNAAAWKEVLTAKDKELNSVKESAERERQQLITTKDAEIERQNRIIGELVRRISIQTVSSDSNQLESLTTKRPRMKGGDSYVGQ